MAEDQRKADEERVEGLVSHIELFSRDVSRSVEFYSQVFGWTCNEYDLGGERYMGWMCPDGGVPGGFRKVNTTQQPATVNYVKTYDIDAVLQKIRERGARVLLEKVRIPGVGYMARFSDPFGNILGLFEPE
jgi:predicted enzyme related to lactoylglutathione lyase